MARCQRTYLNIVYNYYTSRYSEVKDQYISSFGQMPGSFELEPFDSHLGKTLFSHNYDCSSSIDCTGVGFTLPQSLTIHSMQSIE